MNDNLITINTTNSQYNLLINKFISFEDNTITNTTKTVINQPGILITFGNTIDITFYNYTYGNMTKINVVYSSMMPNLVDIRIFVNYKPLPFINIYSYNQQPETFQTIFKSNANTVKKNETITFIPKYAIGCDEYELLQTYILTNEIITPKIFNQTITEIEEDMYNHANFLIVPQYRTVIEAMNTIMMVHTYAEFASNKINSTSLLTEDVLCMAGIENNRMNYIHFINPTMEMKPYNVTEDNLFIFNAFLSMYSYQFAKFSLNTVKYNCSSTAIDKIIGFSQINSFINHIVYNNTKNLILHHQESDNISIDINIESGIIFSIININGFEYNGAVTEAILPLNNNINIKSSNLCYEFNIFTEHKDKSKNLLGLPLDSPGTIIEDFAGGLLIGAGCALIGGTVVAGPAAAVAGFLIFSAGVGVIADANGLTTDVRNITRLFNTGISVGLSLYLPAKISRLIPSTYKLAKTTKFFEQNGKLGYRTKILMNGFHETKVQMMDFVQSQIYSQEAKNYILPYFNEE